MPNHSHGALQSASPPVAGPCLPDWTRDAIVRVAPARFRFDSELIDDVLFVLPEGIVLAEKDRATRLPERGAIQFETLTIDDRRARRSIRRLRWEEIARINCSWRCEAGLMPKRSRRFGRDLCITPTTGELQRMFLPYDDATRVLDAARFHIGDRVVEDVEPFLGTKPAEEWRSLEVVLASIPPAGLLFSLVFLIVACVAIALGWPDAEPSESARRARRRALVTACVGAMPALAALLALPSKLLSMALVATPLYEPLRNAAGFLLLAGILGAIVLAPLAVMCGRTTMLAFPKRRLDRFPERPAPPVHWFDRVCALWPERLRGKRMSMALRIVGAAMFPLSYASASLLGAGILAPYLVALALGLTTAFLYLGYRMSAQSATRLRGRDARAPILFLRSFQDDGRGTFNVSDWRASFLGIQAVQGIHFLGPLANSNPVRLFRLLVGRGGDTSEEQLAGYFGSRGPFIAIGRPNEGLPTTGAARDYVADEVWRDRVDAWMAESQLVVIQPGASSGIWWEIERALEGIPRQRLLFCLLSFDRRPSEYETFALRLRSVLGADIPLYRGDALFMAFDEGAPVEILPCYRTPFAWPISGCTADFAAMLDARFDGTDAAPSEVDWRPGRFRFDATVVAAGLCWSMVSIIMSVAINQAVVSVGMSMQLSRLEKAPFGSMSRPVRWAGLEWDGTDQFEPSSDQPIAFCAPGVAIGGCALQFQQQAPVNLDLLCESTVQNFLRLDPRSAAYSTRRLSMRGIEWVERRYGSIELAGVPHTLVIRAGESEGRVLLHWAMHRLGLPFDIRPGFERLVDSVRPAQQPVEGLDFAFEPDADWQKLESPPASRATFKAPNGDVVDLAIGPAPMKMLESQTETILRSTVLALQPEGSTVEIVRSDFRTTPGGGQILDVTFAIDRVDRRALARFRLISRGGWIYTVVVESGRGEAALADIESAVERLRVR